MQKIFIIITIKCLFSPSFSQAQSQIVFDSLLQNTSYHDAVAYFEKNIVSDAPTDSLSIYQIVNNLQYLILINKTEKAEGIIKKCEIAAQTYTKTDFLKGICIFQRGRIAIKNLRFSNALLYFQQAEPLLKSHSETYLEVLLSQSVALLGLGELEKSKEILLKMEKWSAENFPESKSKAIIQHQKGTIALVEGNLVLAENFFLETEDLFQKAKQSTGLQYSANRFKLALLYFFTGRYEKTKVVLEELLPFYEKKIGKDHELYIQCFAVLGRINIFLDGKDPEKTLKQSLEMMAQSIGKKHLDYAVQLGSLANFYKKEKRFEESERCFLECKEILEQENGKQHINYYVTLCNLAIVYAATKQYDKAKDFFEIVLKQGETILGKNSSAYITSQYSYALMLTEQGKYEDAFSFFKNANNVQKLFLSNYLNFLNEDERVDYYQTVESNFEAFNTLAMAYPKPEVLEELLDLRLYSKGLLLNENNRIVKTILNTDNQEVRENYQNFLDLKKQLAKSYALSPAQLTAAKIDLAELEEKSNTLEKKLMQSSQTFFDWQNTQQQAANTIFKDLKEDESAIEIIRFREQKHDDFTEKIFYNYLIVNKKDNFLTYKLLTQKNGKSLENAQYESYYIEATKRYGAVSLMSELGNIFWKNMDKELIGKKKIYLSLDGIYHKINLETLQNQDGKYLGELYDFTILTNLKEIANENNHFLPKNPTALLLGNPAYDLQNLKQYDLPDGWENSETRSFELKPNPYTQKEVSAIHKMLTQNNWKSTLYVKKEAKEEVLKNLNYSPTLLHIASHGYYLEYGKKYDNFPLGNAKNPLLHSMLFLSGSQNTLQGKKTNDEDGIFTAYEMANLDLRQTELVVLSACHTGLGKIKNGEGVYGLQRAIMSAGAKSLIISLWEVDDKATQLLMSHFYSYWATGINKHEALKKAKSEVKQVYPEPFYWGGFVLIGK